MLLNAGANPNEEEYDGDTPLHKAVRRVHKEVIQTKLSVEEGVSKKKYILYFNIFPKKSLVIFTRPAALVFLCLKIELSVCSSTFQCSARARDKIALPGI